MSKLKKHTKRRKREPMIGIDSEEYARSWARVRFQDIYCRCVNWKEGDRIPPESEVWLLVADLAEEALFQKRIIE